MSQLWLDTGDYTICRSLPLSDTITRSSHVDILLLDSRIAEQKCFLHNPIVVQNIKILTNLSMDEILIHWPVWCWCCINCASQHLKGLRSSILYIYFNSVKPKEEYFQSLSSSYWDHSKTAAPGAKQRAREVFVLY